MSVAYCLDGLVAESRMRFVINKLIVPSPGKDVEHSSCYDVFEAVRDGTHPWGMVVAEGSLFGPNGGFTQGLAELASKRGARLSNFRLAGEYMLSPTTQAGTVRLVAVTNDGGSPMKLRSDEVSDGRVLVMAVPSYSRKTQAI